jgi:PAS domain S-box-containing protein
MGVISLPIVTDESKPSKDSASAGFERVGSFSYLAVQGRWEWSDAVARMHGYEPGAVVPTTELILSHKHPDDEPVVSDLIDRVLRHGAAFSSRHRIIDTSGSEHVVVVVGDQLFGEAGEVVGTAGFYIDLTEAFEADMQKSVTAAVAQVEARRALIHEAIGIIRMAYGVSAERAFEVLRWRSQQTNVKLRTIAEHFVETVVKQPLDGDARNRVDHAPLTAHQGSARQVVRARPIERQA